MPDVSVVIPAYNPGSVLRRALTSVLAQRGAEFEVVVVDDGSSEDLSWVGDMDSRVRLTRVPNAGVSVARNLGVSLSQAPLVAFLDQDDEWLPGKLDAQVRMMKAAPGAPFCSTAFIWAWPDREVSDGRPMTYSTLLADGMVCLSSAMVRKEDYTAVGGHDPALSQVGDFDLFLKLSRYRGVPAHVARELVRYHYHGTNASADYVRARAERRSVLLRHSIQGEPDSSTPATCAIRRGLGRTDELFAAQAYDAFRLAVRGGRPEALRHLARALAWDPISTLKSLARTLARPSRAVRSAKQFATAGVLFRAACWFMTGR